MGSMQGMGAQGDEDEEQGGLDDLEKEEEV